VERSKKVAFYARTRQAVERCETALYTLHGAVWLGFLCRADLDRVTAERYAAVSARQHDEGYNRRGLNSWESATIADYFGSCRSVLVAGAGGGREVIALARRNLRVDGFECNPRLADVARKLLGEERLSAQVIGCASNEVPVDLGTYDGGIVGFGAYVRLAGRDTRVRFLAELARHVSPGGPLLLSFAIRGQSRGDRYAAAITRTIQRVRGVGPPVEVGDTLGDFFSHRFTEEEVAAEIRDAGLEMVALRSQPYGHAIARSVAG